MTADSSSSPRSPPKIELFGSGILAILAKFDQFWLFCMLYTAREGTMNDEDWGHHSHSAVELTESWSPPPMKEQGGGSSRKYRHCVMKYEIDFLLNMV